MLVERPSGLGDLALPEEGVVVAHLLGRGAHDAGALVDERAVGAELDEAGAAAVLGVQEHLVAAGATGLEAGIAGHQLDVRVAGLLEGVDGVGGAAAGRQGADGGEGGERQGDETLAHGETPWEWLESKRAAKGLAANIAL